MPHSELGPSIHGLCCWCHLPRRLPCHLPRRSPRCLPSQSPRHLPYQHYFPCHCHVSRHVIVHVNLHVIIVIHVITISAATSSSMSSLCDMTIESVTKIILFVTLIFVIENGLGLGFRAWRHSMTVLKRHRSSNLWRKFKKCHEVWSVTLSTWRYLRSS